MTRKKEVSALERGFRGRALMLGLLVLGGLGAALWSGTRDEGIGLEELRHRLMVVAPSGEVDYYVLLERAGFAVEVDSYEAWLERARQARPKSEAQGVALLLEFADLEGRGYVVIQDPGERDFSEVESEPAPAEFESFASHAYAVLSVGDLAFPHHLSVDVPGDDPFVRLPGYGAIEAIYAQPSLHVRADPERPTIEELQHEDRIEPGQRMFEQPATFAQALADSEAEIGAALAEGPHAPALIPPLSTGSALFGPDGSVLVVHHPLEVYSEDAKSLAYHPGEWMRFDTLAPAAVHTLLAGGELGLEPCPSLAGGSIEMSRAPQLEAAVDGSALAISTRGGSTTLWHKQAVLGCEWVQVADLDGRMGNSMVLAPARAGGFQLLMAQAGVERGGLSVLRAWSGQGLQTEQDLGASFEVADLFWLPRGRFSSLVVVDADHLAVLSRTPLARSEQTTTRRADHALHLLDRRTPGAQLHVPAEFIAPGWSLLELALVQAPRAASRSESARGPAFVLTATKGPGETEILQVEIAAETWAEFQRAALAEAEALGSLAAGAPTRLHALTPDELEIRRLPGVADQARHALNAMAGRVAYVRTDGPHPSELVWFDTHSSDWQLTELTDNSLVETLPRLSADGRSLVFMSMVRGSVAVVPYSIPRVLALEP